MRALERRRLEAGSTINLARVATIFASLSKDDSRIAGSHRRLVCCLLLSALCLLPSTAPGQEVFDKMVATVNSGVRTDLITYSDLLWQLALQPDTPLINPTSDTLNHALKLVIDQRLILQEAEKLPTIAPTQQEIDASRDDLAKRFAGGEFQQRLRQVGLTKEKLDEILEQRIRIEKYLDFRFRNFVVITQNEIVDYYEKSFVPRFRTQSPGRIVPSLEEVRAEIERKLTEDKIESDTDAFLDSARARAEIVMLNAV